MSETNKHNGLLIVVDMQNDFVDGALGSPEAVAILPNVKKKIEECVKNGMDVILTQDTHGSNYLDTNEGKHIPVQHCIAGTNGHAIVSCIQDNPDFWHVFKGSFGYTEWADFLDTFSLIGCTDRIEIIGLCTDICVISNTLILRALFPDSDIVVDASCCAGSTPENHAAALAVMKACCIDIINEEA